MKGHSSVVTPERENWNSYFPTKYKPEGKIKNSGLRFMGFYEQLRHIVFELRRYLTNRQKTTLGTVDILTRKYPEEQH